MDLRNQLILWTLAETGCRVSELGKLKFDDWTEMNSGGVIHFRGKFERSLGISTELLLAFEQLRETARTPDEWVFQGHNKFGSLGGPITSRGVELLVKAYTDKLGMSSLTPRTFRHSVVIRWHRQGVSKDDIRKRLGRRTSYAFRIYDVLIKSMTAATSIA
jgi:integrase